jgi:hypothetical protein
LDLEQPTIQDCIANKFDIFAMRNSMMMIMMVMMMMMMVMKMMM